MKEIIGENLYKVFKEKDIEAVLSYTGKIGYWSHFEVWELTDTAFVKLDNDEEWKYDDAWWRWSGGSIMGAARDQFLVNGTSMVGWQDEDRIQDLKEEWAELPQEEKKEYGSLTEYINVWTQREFDNILDYLCYTLGASTPRNVCALTVDLARINGMSLGEFFNTYGGN